MSFWAPLHDWADWPEEECAARLIPLLSPPYVVGGILSPYPGRSATAMALLTEANYMVILVTANDGGHGSNNLQLCSLDLWALISSDLDN